MILDGLATLDDDGRIWVRLDEPLPRGFATSDVRVARLDAVQFLPDLEERKRRAVVARHAQGEGKTLHVEMGDASIDVVASDRRYVRAWLDEPAPPPRPPPPLTRDERESIGTAERLVDALERCQLMDPDRAQRLLARITALATKEIKQ